MDDRDKRTAVHPVGAVVPAPATTLWTIQVLRGIAALMVVIGHSQSVVAGIAKANGVTFVRSTVMPWGAGVDLFFVISGFIMVHASRGLFGKPGAGIAFLRRRLVRVVPLYWMVTAAFLTLLGAAALKGGDPFPGIGAIVASLSFVPMDTRGDGRLFPVYDLGWTLNYEMAFYVLFALVVARPRGQALVALGAVLAACVVAGTSLSGPSPAWFWTRPIILDFGLGVAIGAGVAHGLALSGPVRILLGGAGLSLLLADPAQLFAGAPGVTVANAWPRVIGAGVPIASVLAALLLGREPRMPRAALPLTKVGDASYSLYLFHPFALIGLEKAAQKLPQVAHAPGWLLVPATVATALGLAFAAWRWIERPLTTIRVDQGKTDDAATSPAIPAADGTKRRLHAGAGAGGDLSRPFPARTRGTG